MPPAKSQIPACNKPQSRVFSCPRQNLIHACSGFTFWMRLKINALLHFTILACTELRTSFLKIRPRTLNETKHYVFFFHVFLFSCLWIQEGKNPIGEEVRKWRQGRDVPYRRPVARRLYFTAVLTTGRHDVMAPWKPLGGYEQQRKANVKGVVWETDQRPWEETTGGKYEAEGKISTVESGEDGEANAGGKQLCFMVVKSDERTCNYHRVQHKQFMHKRTLS